MHYMQFYHLMRDFTVFSLADIRMVDPVFHRRRLHEWQQKGYLRKVIKGYYMFAHNPLSEKVLFEISNRIYSPSYVSLDTALWFYGLIPESVYGISCISTRRTYRFQTSLGQMTYVHVLPRLFFGYNLMDYDQNKIYNLASPEKAILDYLYSHPSLRSEEDFSSLRLNPDRFRELIQEEQLHAYVQRFGNKSLGNRLKGLCRSIQHA
jgi:predicted transcriptional regulator of viral defense system